MGKLTNEQKQAFIDFISVLKDTVCKGKTSIKDEKDMKKHLLELGFTHCEVNSREDLYFI